MEVGKDLSRKEKITQAKALLEEGEWKELEEGRKMRRDILADHICSQAKLFENMHDGINNSGGTKSGEGAWAYVATAIAEAKGVNPNSIYNKLYPETPNKQKHQLMQEALFEADRAYKVNPEISNCELVDTIMDAYYDLCKDNNIDLKPSSSESEGKNPSRSRTFEWKYTRVPKEAFPKQEVLTNLQNFKNAMRKCNMEFPAEQASELDKLEKEAKAWNEERTVSKELKEARSANYKEYDEQVEKLAQALTSIAKKADMLAKAGEAGIDICRGLANGTEEEKKALEQLKNNAKGMAALKQAIENLNK